MTTETNAELLAIGQEQLTTYGESVSSFIDQLRNFVDTVAFNVAIPGGRVFAYTPNYADFVSVVNNPPTRPNTTFNSPTATGSVPDVSGIDTVNPITVPGFEGAAPEVTIPAAPSLLLPTEPSAPTVNDIFAPVADDVVLPDLPTLTDVEFPSAPTITIPKFSEQFPDIPDLLAPSNTFEYADEGYENEVLDLVQALLKADLTDGGYGVASVDEEALYERTKDREVRAAIAQEGEVIRSFSTKGHSLPTGAMAELVNQAKQDLQNKLSDVNRDINIKRADILRQARQFALTQGTTVNQMLLTDYGFRQERLLRVEQFGAEFAIKIFDAQVRRFNTELEHYKAFTDSYQAEIQGLIAQTQIFKTQVEASIAKQEANRIQLEIYNSQIAGVEALVRVYQNQLRATEIQVSIEQAKITQYTSQIQAFVAQVDARKTEVGLYESAIRGELAKTEIFKSQVDAYRTQVSAAATQTTVEIQNVETQIRAKELDLRVYNANITKYQEELRTEVARVASLTTTYASDTDAYKANIAGWSSFFSSLEGAWDLFNKAQEQETSLDQEAARLQIEKLKAAAELRLKGIETGVIAYDSLLSTAQSMKSLQGTSDDD